MVRIASYVPLLLSFVAFASSTPVKRTVAEVNAAIASISSQTSALDTAITNYPATGGTLAGALVSRQVFPSTLPILKCPIHVIGNPQQRRFPCNQLELGYNYRHRKSWSIQ